MKNIRKITHNGIEKVVTIIEQEIPSSNSVKAFEYSASIEIDGNLKTSDYFNTVNEAIRSLIPDWNPEWFEGRT